MVIKECLMKTLSDMEYSFEREMVDNNITVKTERFRRQEMLFQTSLSRGNWTFQSVDSFAKQSVQAVLQGNTLEGTVTPALFTGSGANQNVGYREPEQKQLISPKAKKMSVASSRRSSTGPSRGELQEYQCRL